MMPLFTAQARFLSFDVLGGLDFGLLGWTTGFLAAFTCFVGDIGVVVFKKRIHNGHQALYVSRCSPMPPEAVMRKPGPQLSVAYIIL